MSKYPPSYVHNPSIVSAVVLFFSFFVYSSSDKIMIPSKSESALSVPLATEPASIEAIAPCFLKYSFIFSIDCS